MAPRRKRAVKKSKSKIEANSTVVISSSDEESVLHEVAKKPSVKSKRPQKLKDFANKENTAEPPTIIDFPSQNQRVTRGMARRLAAAGLVKRKTELIVSPIRQLTTKKRKHSIKLTEAEPSKTQLSEEETVQKRPNLGLVLLESGDVNGTEEMVREDGIPGTAPVVPHSTLSTEISMDSKRERFQRASMDSKPSLDSYATAADNTNVEQSQNETLYRTPPVALDEDTRSSRLGRRAMDCTYVLRHSNGAEERDTSIAMHGMESSLSFKEFSYEEPEPRNNYNITRFEEYDADCLSHRSGKSHSKWAESAENVVLEAFLCRPDLIKQVSKGKTSLGFPPANPNKQLFPNAVKRRPE